MLTSYILANSATLCGRISMYCSVVFIAFCFLQSIFYPMTLGQWIYKSSGKMCTTDLSVMRGGENGESIKIRVKAAVDL